MSNFTKDAFNISQDIYNISGDLERLNDSYKNFEISPEVYANSLYVIACKISYLKGVIETIKQHGYKFSNYEKELTLLASITENVDENFKISNMGDFEEDDLLDFVDLSDKYSHILPLEDEDEYEYDDDLNNLCF